jgi:lipoprotein-releasing system ATP-binding protein
LIELKQVCKTCNPDLPNGAEGLHGIELRVNTGEFIAPMRLSGSGQSTLLNIVGLLERMTAGHYQLQGEETVGLDDAGLAMRRRRLLGFVFQFHHPLPAFTALENVTLTARMAVGRVSGAQRDHAKELLDSVGLSAAPNKRLSALGALRRHAEAGSDRARAGGEPAACAG